MACSWTQTWQLTRVITASSSALSGLLSSNGAPKRTKRSRRSRRYGGWKNPHIRDGSSPSAASTRNHARYKSPIRRSMWEERVVMARGARRGTAMAGTDSALTLKQRNGASTGFAAILKSDGHLIAAQDFVLKRPGQRHRCGGRKQPRTVYVIHNAFDPLAYHVEPDG